MPHHDLESTIPGERLYNPESRNPLGTQFKSSFGREKGSPASPSTATRASLTSSPRPQPYDNKDLIHREESIQHREAINAPKRLGRLKESSFNSSTTFETCLPPISPMEETLETLPVEEEHHLGARALPRSKMVSFIPVKSPSKSPSRALSLPTVSDRHSEALEDNPDAHRAISTMSKRSASTRKLQTVPLLNVRNGHRPSQPKQKKATLVLIDEDDAEDEINQVETVPNPIGATQSMPDLRESPERQSFPIAFLPNLIEHQKRTQRVVTRDIGGPSGEQEETAEPSLVSNWSHEFQTSFRPLTQAVRGENPPGIMVYSQSQSQDGASGRKRATTLVVGTPSSASESSQPERFWESSQLYKEGRSLFQNDSEEELVPTQSVLATQEVGEVVATQVLDEIGMAPVDEKGIRNADAREQSPQPLLRTLDISPAKSRRHHPSASDQSIHDVDSGRLRAAEYQKTNQKAGNRSGNPGLSPSKPNGVQPKLEYTPSKPVPVFPRMNNSRATLRSNPTPTFGSQNRDLGTATTAPNLNRHYQPSNDPPLLGKLPSNPLKRNPLIRRRTPPDIDRYLFEKEVDVFITPMEGTSSALGTLLVEETIKTAPKGPSVVTEAAVIKALPEKTLKLGIKESFSAHDSALPKDQDEGPPRSAMPEKMGLERSFSHRGIIKETETMTVHNESLPERATTINMSGKTLVPIAPTVDPVILTEEPIQEPVSDSSTRSPTAEPNHLVRPEGNIDDSSDSEGENISEYEPQDLATQQDTLEHEVTPSEQSEEEGETLFHKQKRKRGAKVQGGRGLKRICRRKNSPKVDALMEDHTETPERSPPAIRRPILSPLDTRNIDTVGPMSTRRSTRATRESRTRTGSNTRKSAALGHFVIVRRSETKRYFAGYAVERSGKHWQVDPCDGGVPIFAEPKHLRKCVFQEGDLVYVSPDGVGENIGDAIVVAVDERWDEERLVQVNIGDEPKRYVAARYLSVLERNIKQWDSRKITQKDLETEDGVETMPPPTSALGRSNSMITPAKTSTNGSSIRIPQVGSNKHFFGAGFILSNCDDTMARRIKDRGGFIYNSWLFAYRFNGGIEKIKSNKSESRWIRRAEQARGRNKGQDLPAVQWIGDEIESTVKTIFVVAGKVATTAKNLIALALGVPIISFQWIEACETAGERVDWIPYLLPSHNQPNPLALDPELPGILPLQMPDPMWGSQAYGVTVLRDILTHSPLLHRRILLNKPMALYLSDGCIQKLKDDSKEGKKAPSCSSPFAYLLLALGAQHVEAVEQHFHATDPTLLKYDIIVVSDAWFSDIIPKKSKVNKGMNNALSTAIDKGALVISQSDLKLTIACGRVVKAPVSEKSSPTIDT